MTDQRLAPMMNTFLECEQKAIPSLLTACVRSKSFDYATHEMKREFSFRSESDEFVRTSSKCLSREDNEENDIDILSDGMDLMFEVESSGELHTKAIDVPCYGTEATEAPYGSFGALTEFSDTTDEEEESMSTFHSITSVESVTLPRLLGRGQTVNSLAKDGDVVKEPNVDLADRNDVARACAESARDYFFKRMKQIESRKIVSKDEQKHTDYSKEAAANDETCKPVERTSPVALPRLLGRGKTADSVKNGDAAKAVNLEFDAARACAESARDHFLKRKQRIETRKIVIKDEQSNFNDGKDAEANGATFHPPGRTLPLGRLLGSQATMHRHVSDGSSVPGPCDAVFEATCAAKLSNEHDATRTSDETRACAQLALEAFRARKNRITSRKSSP